MTKNALLEKGPKNSGMGRPPPPSFGQCPKENVFFHWCLPLWDKAVTHTGILPTFWNVTWLCWDQMNLSRHTMVTSRLDLNWLKLSTVWVDRRPFQLDPAVPLWFCQQVSNAWNYKNVHLFEFKFIWPKNMLFKSVILTMWFGRTSCLRQSGQNYAKICRIFYATQLEGLNNLQPLQISDWDILGRFLYIWP